MFPNLDETIALSRADLRSSLRSKEPLTLVLMHREGTTVVDLRARGSVVVGRTGESDVLVPDDTLSRRHARLSLDGSDVLLEDLSSKNGSFVNGTRVAGTMRVRATDQVMLGGVVVLLVRQSAASIDTRGFLAHDTFLFLVGEEVGRARHFARPFALVLLRARDGGQVAPLAQDPGLADVLRPTDRLALFSDDTLELFLPESDTVRATATAERLHDLSFVLGVRARVVVAPYPAAGSTADALLERAREALIASTPSSSTRSDGRDVVVLGQGDGDVADASASRAAVLGGARIRGLYDEVRRVAESSVSVLVTGETGTGKELVARAIHDASPRRRTPLVTVNCGAIQESLIESTLFGHVKGAFTGADRDRAGVFESAKGGTVFLDEVGELPLSAQAKLLRVLEEKRVTRVGAHVEIDVDFRVVAATHRDLEAMVRAGRFREDLFQRLHVVPLVVPPLRERRDEIPALAQHFVARFAEQEKRPRLAISDDAMAALTAYAWPGNVRELRNTITRACFAARSGAIGLDDLDARVRRVVDVAPSDERTITAPPSQAIAAPSSTVVVGGDFRTAVRDYERRVLLHALAQADGVQTKAASLVGLPLRTFVHKMKALGVRRARAGYVVDDE